MGKRQGFHGAVQHQTFYEKARSPCTKRRTKQTSQNMVWVPKIASWEKEFCYKIGLFTWENLLEAKKQTRFSHKILEWNDSAGEEAFHRSKNRFFAMINGVPNPDECDVLSPDLYIDEIDWDDEDEASLELHEGLESARRESGDDEEEEENGNGNRNVECVPDYYHIRIEDIKPTGWDCKVEEFSPGNILTGQIIGY